MMSPIQKCLSFLNSSSHLSHLLQIHAQILTLGLSTHQFITSQLINLSSLSHFANLNYALSLLSHSPNQTTSSYNHVIRAYSSNSNPFQALLLFSIMRKTGVHPNELTYPFVIKSCACVHSFKLGIQLHCDVIKSGFGSVVYINNTIMLLYGNYKHIADVNKLLDEMPERTIVSWNTVLTAYVNELLYENVISIFKRMRFDGFEPDPTTYVLLLSVCTMLGSLRFGKWIHSQLIAKGIVLNVQLGTSVVNMYTKCGDITCAFKVFDAMLVKNVWTWSAMITAFAQHGLAKEALELFSNMKRSSVKPNQVTFLGVLCACVHAGLVNEGYQYFSEMVNKYGIKPNMTHYSAMVDVLGRKGNLRKAYNFILDMPVNADVVVWRTLLSACQLHSEKDAEGIGEKVKGKLLELEPNRCGNYVMIANMLSENGSWEEAAKVRKIMRDEGLMKIAGESCIEVDKSIYRFVSGFDAYKVCRYIYYLLEGLSLNMKIDDVKDAILFQE